MKTNIVLIALLVWGTGNVKSQSLFGNSGFEEWDTTATHTDPRGWYTLNELTQFGLPATTTLTTDAHSGKYAVLMKSEIGATTDLTGLISTGPILNSSGSADFSNIKKPFTGRPTALRFYYKSFPMTGDSCAALLVLTRWNIAQQRTDTIGMASFAQGDSVTTYTLADVPVDYYSPLTPDSAYLIMSSSLDGFNPLPGTQFYVDDLELVLTSGIATTPNEIKLDVYPNPTRNGLYIETPDQTTATIRIVTVDGKLMYIGTHTTNSYISIETWNAGVYFLSFEQHGNTTYRKIIIQQ